MTFEIERSAATRTDRTMPVIIADTTEQALLGLCETRGWSLGVVLQLAVVTGVRELQHRGEPVEAGAAHGSTNQPDTVLYDIIARLCAENARLCAENARLHEWIEQCRTGRAPSIPTVDAPSPAWLWRYRPFR